MSEPKSNVPAVKSTTVIDGINFINTKLAELKTIQESVYKTTGKLAGFPKPLQEETKIEEIVKMFSSVRAREQSYNQAADELKLREVPLFKLEGSTAEDWKNDCELRIAIIENKERLDELNTLKKEYEELMDKEDRMAILASKMSKLK